METTQVQRTSISISAAEIEAWLASNMALLEPNAMRVISANQNPRAPGAVAGAIGVIFWASREQLDSFLRPLIENLPEVKKYNLVVHPDDGSLIVTWGATIPSDAIPDPTPVTTTTG